MGYTAEAFLSPLFGSNVYCGEITDLEEDLEDALNPIAYDEWKGIEEILEDGERIKKKHSSLVNRLGPGWENINSALGLYVHNVLMAYHGFLYLCDEIRGEDYVDEGKLMSEKIVEDVRDILGEHLEWNPDLDHAKYAKHYDESSENLGELEEELCFVKFGL